MLPTEAALWVALDADDTRSASCLFCDATIFPTRDDRGRRAWVARFATTACPERDALLEGPFRGEVPDDLPHIPRVD